MKNIFALIFLVLSSSAFSLTLKYRVCVTDMNNFCIAYNKTPNYTEIFVPQAMNDIISAEARAVFVSRRIIIASQNDAEYLRDKNSYKETQSSYSEAQHEVDTAVSSFGRNAFACAISGGGCIAGIIASVDTFGLAFWGAKIACASTGGTCAFAAEDYEAWMEAEKKLAEEQKNDPTVAHDGTPNPHTSVGGPGTPVGPSGSLPTGFVTWTEGPQLSEKKPDTHQ